MSTTPPWGYVVRRRMDPVDEKRHRGGRGFGMTGRDFVIGNVTDVIDGETVNITVDRTGGIRRRPFRGKEKIRINRLRLTDIAWLTGAFTRSQAEKMLKGKQVLCLVRSHDAGGLIIADIQLMQ